MLSHLAYFWNGVAGTSFAMKEAELAKPLSMHCQIVLQRQQLLICRHIEAEAGAKHTQSYLLQSTARAYVPVLAGGAGAPATPAH